MNSIVRTLVALLLCALLPLQAGAALSRSTAMSASHASRAAPRVEQPLAADHGTPSHHAHHGHHAVSNDGAAPQAVALPAPSHKDRHAKAECQSCAKCCLMAASAPPPVLTPTLAPAVTRAAFIPSADPAPAFLTDGPERPPRFPSA